MLALFIYAAFSSPERNLHQTLAAFVRFVLHNNPKFSMDGVQVPEYYLCPISLQIMKDPVTTITGITYDRENIEKWLKSPPGDEPTCPVTKQLLSRDSDLTPNHMLHRLIQAWCTANGQTGFHSIPTTKAPLSKTHLLNLVKDLKSPQLCVRALKKMGALAADNEKNRTCMAEAGVGKGLVSFVITCFRQRITMGIEDALRILHLLWNLSDEIKILTKDNHDFIDSLMWLYFSGCGQMESHVVIKTQSMLLLKKTIEIASTSLMEKLKPDFIKGMIRVIREKISQQALKSALFILIQAWQWGINRSKMVEAKAVFVLIELELEKPEKNITELIFNLLSQLCSSADGREQLLQHAGSIAMISKRILRVSPATDDRAVHILGLVSKFSGTNQLLVEMLRVGAVTKLCMVIQADCPSCLKHKAREILRLRSNVWSNSPCIAVYLLTRYPCS